MDSAPENEFWVVCPICDELNPQGVSFCQHCWGAIIKSGHPLPYEKALAASRRRRFYRKLRKSSKLATISLVSFTVLAGSTYLGLYHFSDLITKPEQSINSDSLPGDWAMFRHDLSRSGMTNPGDSLPQGTLKWVFSTDAEVHSSPAVANGTVYVGSRDFRLYALDAATGAKRWEYKTNSWVESSPAVVDGVVYFGSNDGHLYALNADNGHKLWEFRARYPIKSSPAVAEGIVYFGADDYYIYALDAATGEKLWDFKTNGYVASSPVVANGILYSGSGEAFSYALDARNGMRRLRFKSHYPVFSSAVVKDETVYFSNTEGLLYAIDGTARSWPREHEIKPFWIQIWAFGLPGIPAPPPQSGLLWTMRLSRTASSSPVLSGDTLYIGSGDKLLAVDLNSREKSWEFQADGVIHSSPAIADTTIYMGSEDGRLYAIDATTGQKLWDFATGDKITSSPAVANGTIYIGSHDGNLYAIE